MADKTLVVGDAVYEFEYVPAEFALKVQLFVMKTIGDALFRAFMDYRTNGGTQEAELIAGAQAITAIAARADAAELKEAMETVFRYTIAGKKGEPARKTVTLDDFNGGKTRQMWQVFIAALRFNFSDFLPDGLLPSGPAKA